MQRTKPIKIMFYADAYNSTSGYSKVGHELAKRLAKDPRFEIFFQELVTQRPFTVEDNVRILPAFFQRNQKGFLNVIINHLQLIGPDILFPISDVFLLHRDGLSELKFNNIKLIPYIMMDSDNIPDCADRILNMSSKIITGSQHGKDTLATGDYNSEVLFHGVDFGLYKPISNGAQIKLKLKYGFEPSDKIFLTVGRNFIRKRLQRLLEAIAIYNKNNPFNNTKFLFHSSDHDNEVWNLEKFTINVGKKYNTAMDNVRFTEKHNLSKGVTEDKMAEMYQLSDFYITASAGEGFGLPLIESMATKKLVIGPDNTTHKTFLAEGRGIIVPNDGYVYTGFGTSCPVVDIPKLATTIEEVLLMSDDKINEITDKAYEWAKVNCNWDNIAEQLKEVFLNEVK